jgi:sugar-specific transcriptional regulator TrmB
MELWQSLSLKRLLATLKGFGLKRSDAKIYVYLAKKGPSRARDICTKLKLTKQQLYPCLENLQKKGMVYATLEHPALFYALPFERVLDMFVDMRIDEAEEVQKHKTEILSSWQSMETEDVT